MILRTISVATVLALSMALSACGTTGKTGKPMAATQMSLPTLNATHLVPHLDGAGTPLAAEDWLQSAQGYFDSHNYTRALRAANEALALDPDATEARKIALLSTIRIVQQNSSSYHNKALINDSEREEIKEGLTSVTSLINAS